MATRGQKHGKARGEESLKLLLRQHPEAKEMIEALWMYRSTMPRRLKQLSNLSNSAPILTLHGVYGRHFREISWVADLIEQTTKTGDSTALERFAIAFGYYCKNAIHRNSGQDADKELWGRVYLECERPPTSEIAKWVEEGRSCNHAPMTLGALYKITCKCDGTEMSPILISKTAFRQKLNEWGFTYLKGKRGKPPANSKGASVPAEETPGQRNKD